MCKVSSCDIAEVNMIKARSKYMLQTFGGESLKKQSEKVVEFDAALSSLSKVMIKAMNELNGIGLAAVQIGVFKRIIVLNIPMSSMSNPPTPGEIQLLGQMPMALVNPEITGFNSEIVPYDEGCLSVPDVYAEVLRPSQIQVRAQDLNGNTLEFECGGLLARCIQHEVDHLNGIVFVDRLTDEVRAQVSGELEALRRRGKKFNYQRTINL